MPEIARLTEHLMYLVDQHGSERWNTGAAEQARARNEAGRCDAAAVKKRAEIEKELALVMAVVEAARHVDRSTRHSLGENMQELRAALAALEAAP